MKPRQIAEMALDLGDVPNWIHPSKQARIVQGTHPYAKNKAFPTKVEPTAFGQQPVSGKIKSYAEFVASDQYPRTVKRLQQALGNRMPTGPNAPMQLMMIMMSALQKAVQLERGHEHQLEQMAIELVLNLPEFELYKAAYADGDLKIEAKLTTQIDLSGAQMDSAEPDEEQQAQLDVDQIAQELDAEVEKRRMVNVMIQGSAINKNFAFHIIRDALDQLNPELVNTYSLLLSGGELMYWVMSDEMQKSAMGGGGEGAGGVEKLEFEEDGTPVIKAQAIVFPVLVQEIVKGLMELLAHDDNDDNDTRKYALGQADTLGNETWDIKFGPTVWRKILGALGDDQKYMPYVFRWLLELPTSEFNNRVRQILNGVPDGLNAIRSYVDSVKSQESGAATELPDEPGGQDQGGSDQGEPDNNDWWKKG